MKVCEKFECMNIFVPCCRFPFMPIDWADNGASHCVSHCPYHSCTYCRSFNLFEDKCTLLGGDNE